ncbi:intercellular adhesion molecule 5-like [Haemorhous mexicanus]|uniref:intercellular adhesion molecule 5-like n=1 Tax=Haemorhous mexicanus TaxID=30427 RepID=UPI0028BE6DEA|nr:intercellular adhesion molecule 5-like [Haemorhous mexicanus]
MVAPALLALALGALGVVAVPPEGPLVSLSAPEPKPKEPFNVTCSVGRAVPVTNITITASNRTWPVTPSQDGHQATATVTVTKEGSVQLGCTVHVGSRKVQTSTTIQAYNVPMPLLDVTNTTMAGMELEGNCSLPADAFSDIQVKAQARNRDLGDFQKPPVPFSVQVREEDAERGLEVTCVAEMKPFTPRKKSQRIRVLVKPRLDIERCPPQQNWTEGQEGILTCKATGTPEPQVRCSKDGNSLEPGMAHPADRAHAGTYLCRATSELGTAERNVTVWVQYDDSFPLLPVLLGALLPAAALLGLIAFLLYRYNTKIGEYWLWKRQPPPDAQPLRSPGSSAAAAAAPNGSAAP